MEQTNKQNNSYVVPLMTLTVLFFMWGFITCLNDMLIPYFQKVFDLTGFKANLVQFAFFLAYFVISLLYFIVSAVWKDPIQKIGYKVTILLGLTISAAACFIFFYEAGSANPQYLIFLGALFVLGTGLAFLQISANPLVSILGSQDTASSRLNLSQGFNSLGTTIAPILGAAVIFSEIGQTEVRLEDKNSVEILYLCIAGVLVLLSILIFFSNIPNLKSEKTDFVEDKIGALRYPHLVFGMLAIFFYVGGEVSIGSNLIKYMTSDCVHSIVSENIASKFLSFYWGGAMIGRFAGSIYMSDTPFSKKILMMSATALALFSLIFILSGLEFADVVYFLIFLVLNFAGFIMAKGVPSRTLGIFAVINVLLISGMLLMEDLAAMWLILAVGLFNSVMFSNIFTLAIKWLGKYTSQASSLLVMMCLGGAVMPPLQGLLADTVSIHYAFALPIICYAYLAWYGFIGCNIRSAKRVYESADKIEVEVAEGGIQEK